jgi:hypothetical protein
LGSRLFIPLQVIFATVIFWKNAKTFFKNA